MQRIGRASYGTEGLWCFDGRFQGRDDEFRDPGLTGLPRSRNVQNSDGISLDERFEDLTWTLELRMQMKHWCPVFPSESSGSSHCSPPASMKCRVSIRTSTPSWPRRPIWSRSSASLTRSS